MNLTGNIENHANVYSNIYKTSEILEILSKKIGCEQVKVECLLKVQLVKDLRVIDVLDFERGV